MKSLQNIIIYDSFTSPVGLITVSTDGQSITDLHIEGDRHFRSIPTSWIHDSEHWLLQRAHQQLIEYFARQRSVFDLPLHTVGTEFQQAVWRKILATRSGETTSYTQIARSLNKPAAVRAVGTAVGRNQISIFIPCHRVLTHNGHLGGYVAGLDVKRSLLALEGITLTSSR